MSTHKLSNCIDLLFTNVPGVVDPLLDPPLGNSDHSSISFSVKMGFKIPNISFSHKVYLKICVNLPHVGDDLYNELNNVITSLFIGVFFLKLLDEK